MKRFFYILFIPCLTAILAVVILHPQNNLVPGRMFLYMLTWVLILFGIKRILSFLEYFLGKKGLDVSKLSDRVMVIYICLYGIGLYVMSLLLRSDPVTDYREIYNAAYGLVTGETAINWEYFSMWTNNLGALTILTASMRLGMLCGFSDPYYFILGFIVLQMMAVMGSIFYLAGGIGEKRLSVQWFAMILFTLWTPIWTSSNAFYTDQLSFGGGVIAGALLKYARETAEQAKLRGWLCVATAGIVWGVAISAKATAAIALVALLILGALSMGEGLKNLVSDRKKLFFWILPAVTLGVTCACFHWYSRTYPSGADEYRLRMPPEYWIAMGLVGDGTYSDNAYLIKECNYSPNVDARRQLCRTIIRDNLPNLLDGDHMYKKTSVIFGSGDISPTSLQYPRNQGFLWELFYWEGEYYWKYTCVSTGFFYAILLLLIAGCVVQAFHYTPDDQMFLCYLTVFGLFLFLMMWEAQNKQLFNHIPWMTLAALYGMDRVDMWVSSCHKMK